MQLEPGERSLLAYFNSYDAAAQAVQSLKAQGYNYVKMDSINPYTRKANYVFPQSISTLTSAAGTAEQHRSYGPLLAAHPSVSGMSSTAREGSYSYLVTVVTQDTRYQQAEETLRSCGASL
jgi:uncharacterized protein YgbK (DUF1537 family)